MFCKRLYRFTYLLHKYKNTSYRTPNCIQWLHTSSVNFEEKSEKDEKQIIPVGSFEEITNKNRNTYLEMVKIYIHRNHVHRRGHVEFVYSALKNMEEFGVHKDLEVYKALIDVLPKGKFIPTNMFQVEFMHYPKQQQCIIDLLEQMEDNGVMPDYEMEDLLKNIFGDKGFPLRKYWRMMYWMPKFKNLSPWPVPDPFPQDTFELAKYAIERISSVDVNSVVTVYQSADIKESIDDTWIVSAQSKIQRRLLSEQDVKQPVYVEGSFKVWIKGHPINYFILRGKPRPLPDPEVDLDDVSKIKVPLFTLKPPVVKHLKVIPSPYEQEDGVIYSVCATGTSSKDSLLSWVRHLEKDGYENLGKMPIVFTLRTGPSEVVNTETKQPEEKKEIEDK